MKAAIVKKDLFVVGVVSGLIASGLAVSGFLYFGKVSANATQVKTESYRPYELLDAMYGLQRYSTKLYYAGSAKNQVLASWYSWKVESVIEDIKGRKLVPYAYNGWDAAELAVMMDPAIVEINRTIDAKDWDAFPARFDNLMKHCNACHTATEHSFVVVQTPRRETLPLNQNFEQRID